MTRLLAILSVLSCFLVAAWGDKAFSMPNQGLMVHDAWAPPSLDGAKVATAFAVFMNHSTKPIEITSLSSPVAEKVELHDHVMTDGKMRMRRITPIILPAEDSIIMKPGGHHLMLIGLTRPLKDGEQITLKITPKDAATITVTIPVSQARLLEALKSRKHSAHEH